MKPKVSIIILSYNARELVRTLDHSITKHCIGTPYEVICVDNGDDGTSDIPGINFIKHDNSGNFSSQNNMASKYAQGETLIFLNNDMVARSDFVTHMHTVLDLMPNVGIVGACLYYPDDTLQHAGVMIQNNLFPANIGEKAIKECALDEKNVRPANWNQTSVNGFAATTGACMAIRTKDFMALGGFHEEFEWNFEDVDLCFRMQLHLRKLVTVSPLAVLTHLESQTGSSRHLETPLCLLQGRWRGIIHSDMHRFQSRG